MRDAALLVPNDGEGREDKALQFILIGQLEIIAGMGRFIAAQTKAEQGINM